MQAIILAAGLGNRLGSLTSDKPKALVQVGGRELILRVMDFLDHPSVESRTVVAGYKSDVLRKFLAEHRPGVRVIENPHFTDGSIRSIEAAIPQLAGDTLIMNVDHIYPRRMMKRIAEAEGGICAICDFDRELVADDMKVKLSGDGRLSLISKALADYDAGYIGMTRVSSGDMAAYRAAIGEVRRDEGDASSVERVIGKLASGGHGINICNTSGIRWLEVDTPEDLAHAERILGTDTGFLS